MPRPDNQRRQPDSSGFRAPVAWLLSQVRPRFHNALLVVYAGAACCALILVWALVRLAFGRGVWLSLELLTVMALPLGSVGVGALVSALLWTSNDNDTRKWVRLTLFGGTSAFVFGLLVQLRVGPPIDPVFCVIATLLGAVGFPLIRWLSLKGL